MKQAQGARSQSSPVCQSYSTYCRNCTHITCQAIHRVRFAWSSDLPHPCPLSSSAPPSFRRTAEPKVAQWWFVEMRVSASTELG